MKNSIYLKIEHAEKHLVALTASIQDFVDDDPCTTVLRRHELTGEWVLYVTSLKVVPVEISLIAGDVVSNLRSALDYTAWRLVMNGGTYKPCSSTAFPISKHPPSNNQERHSFESR